MRSGSGTRPRPVRLKRQQLGRRPCKKPPRLSLAKTPRRSPSQQLRRPITWRQSLRSPTQERRPPHITRPRRLPSLTRETRPAPDRGAAFGALAVRQTKEVERLEIDELGASYVRVRLVQESAAQGVSQLGQTGVRALTGVRQAAADATQELGRGKEETAGFGREMLALMAGEKALGLLRTVGSAMSQVMKEAAEWTARTAKDFVAVQKSMQSIAALSGKGNTTEFALDQVKAAAAANVKPDEYAQLSDAFLSRAGAYIGDDEDMMSPADAEKFKVALAEYASQHGVSMAEMGSFGGGLLALNTEGPNTAEELKKQAGKTFATLEASSAPVAHLLPNMTRVMAQGMSASEAALSSV